MSRNIKEIGKKLMGKSLNSFHRKTGLTQLEENNKMQDGILDGILSQVDDAYIEKTEQSNVIHLEGSGDGVVVLDSIEGNTMVNLCVDKTEHINKNYTSSFLTKAIKHNTEYTVAFELFNITQGSANRIGVSIENAPAYEMNFANFTNGFHKVKVVTRGNNEPSRPSLDLNENVYACFWIPVSANGLYSIKNVVVLEGDWTEKEIPYFEGLQSSFEEKVNDEGKYEIEILSKNKSLINWNIENLENYHDDSFNFSIEDNAIKVRSNYQKAYGFKKGFYVQEGETYTISVEGKKTGVEYSAMYLGDETLDYFKKDTFILVPAITSSNIIDGSNYGTKVVTMVARKSGFVNRWIIHSSGLGNYYWIRNVFLEKGETVSCIPQKQNKIKLLINEPLRAVENIKDRLCVKDGKLMIERNIFEFIEDGSNDWSIFDIGENRQFYKYIPINLIKKSVNEYSKITSMSNNYGKTTFNERGNITSRNCALMTYSNSNNTNLLCIYKPLDFTTEQLKTELNNSPLKMCYQLAEPFYEEITNEYGEPILLEGYENGTLYIDSAIVPTTTVRYTPKMESFNTLKEVYNNNVMLTSDVNDNIIPYMMEVDLMIMEKEMALPSQINIRKMEVLDMTSMQKRTQDMLERLIKGKSLTEQECKTRVTTYLHAGKITDEQAEELMLLIDEVYA